MFCLIFLNIVNLKIKWCYGVAQVHALLPVGNGSIFVVCLNLKASLFPPIKMSCSQCKYHMFVIYIIREKLKIDKENKYTDTFFFFFFFSVS